MTSALDISLRTATPGDLERAFEIIYDDPPQESVAVAGDPAWAKEIGRVVMRAGASIRLDRTVMADSGGRAVGLIETIDRDGSPIRVTPAMVFKVLGQGALITGPRGLVRFFRWQAARARVEIPHPPDSCYIAEIDVDPAFRGRGIGRALLRHAEQRARAMAHTQMSLNTSTINPAQRLYEREGYRIVETRTDPAYERITGIPGRVLMIKDLS